MLPASGLGWLTTTAGRVGASTSGIEGSRAQACRPLGGRGSGDRDRVLAQQHRTVVFGWEALAGEAAGWCGMEAERLLREDQLSERSDAQPVHLIVVFDLGFTATGEQYLTAPAQARGDRAGPVLRPTVRRRWLRRDGASVRHQRILDASDYYLQVQIVRINTSDVGSAPTKGRAVAATNSAHLCWLDQCASGAPTSDAARGIHLVAAAGHRCRTMAASPGMGPSHRCLAHGDRRAGLSSTGGRVRTVFRHRLIVVVLVAGVLCVVAMTVVRCRLHDGGNTGRRHTPRPTEPRMCRDTGWTPGLGCEDQW